MDIWDLLQALYEYGIKYIVFLILAVLGVMTGKKLRERKLSNANK